MSHDENTLRYKVFVDRQHLTPDLRNITGYIAFELVSENQVSISVPVVLESPVEQKIVPSIVNLGLVGKGERKSVEVIINNENTKKINELLVLSKDWKLGNWKLRTLKNRAVVGIELECPSSLGYHSTLLNLMLENEALSFRVTCHVN